MKYIVIYAYNEEMADLKDYAKRLVNKGARVIFHNLAIPEFYAKADTILTFARYLPRVKEMYASTNVTVAAIDGAEDEVPTAEDTAPGLIIELPVEAPVEVAEPVVEISAEELAEVEEIVAASDEIIVTVAEAPTAPKRGRK